MPHLSWMPPERYSDGSDMRRDLNATCDSEGRLDDTVLTYASPTQAAEELYDTQNDPHQVHNLADSARPSRNPSEPPRRAEGLDQPHPRRRLPARIRRLATVFKASRSTNLLRPGCPARPHPGNRLDGRHARSTKLQCSTAWPMTPTRPSATGPSSACKLRRLATATQPTPFRSALDDKSPAVSIEAASALAARGLIAPALHSLTARLQNPDSRPEDAATGHANPGAPGRRRPPRAAGHPPSPPASPGRRKPPRQQPLLDVRPLQRGKPRWRRPTPANPPNPGTDRPPRWTASRPEGHRNPAQGEVLAGFLTEPTTSCSPHPRLRYLEPTASTSKPPTETGSKHPRRAPRPLATCRPAWPPTWRSRPCVPTSSSWRLSASCPPTCAASLPSSRPTPPSCGSTSWASMTWASPTAASPSSSSRPAGRATSTTKPASPTARRESRGASSAVVLHPPWRGGTGRAFQQFTFNLPAVKPITLRGLHRPSSRRRRARQVRRRHLPRLSERPAASRHPPNRRRLAALRIRPEPASRPDRHPQVRDRPRPSQQLELRLRPLGRPRAGARRLSAAAHPRRSLRRRSTSPSLSAPAPSVIPPVAAQPVIQVDREADAYVFNSTAADGRAHLSLVAAQPSPATRSWAASLLTARMAGANAVEVPLATSAAISWTGTGSCRHLALG